MPQTMVKDNLYKDCRRPTISGIVSDNAILSNFCRFDAYFL